MNVIMRDETKKKQKKNSI